MCSLRVTDPKKRKDKHKENEAIEFEFNISSDTPETIANAMVGIQGTPSCYC